MASLWRNNLLHVIEIFPTVLRSTAVGAVALMARIGGLVCPQTIYLQQLSVHLPFTTIGILMFISAMLILFLEDTYKTELNDYLEKDGLLLKTSNAPDCDENDGTRD